MCSAWQERCPVCDIAPFGFQVSDTNGRWHGIRWSEPRKIRRVVAQFEDDLTPPDPCEVTVQYWHRAWNDMPLKCPLWFVHGLPGDRNTMRQHPTGDIDVTAVGRWFALQRSERDSDRKQSRSNRNAGTVDQRFLQGPFEASAVNGQPYERFDADKEWIVLTGPLDGQQEIIARY